jgi:DNA-binding transcriptional regulator LsrR (DeoR family)
MHNIPNTYPSLNPSEHMIGENESAAQAEVPWLKRLSRTYEAGISINDISKELKLDRWTVNRLLKLLSYASEI